MHSVRGLLKQEQEERAVFVDCSPQRAGSGGPHGHKSGPVTQHVTHARNPEEVI